MATRKEDGPKYTPKDSERPLQETRFVVPDKGFLRKGSRTGRSMRKGKR